MGADAPTPELQVLICTYGKAGISRLAASAPPCVPGVGYVVAWQMPEGDCPLPPQLKRPDITVVKTRTRGLSENRNIALRNSTAPLLLIADDDLEYRPERLTSVIDAFSDNPGCDFLTFQCEYGSETKRYPSRSCDIRRTPKYYFVSSVELALRADSVRGRFRFDTRFGVGSTYPATEEFLFVRSMLRAGLRGHFIPQVICRHPRPTTGARLSATEMTRIKGAAFTVAYPLSWPLRLVAHTLRQKRGRLKFVRAWLDGAFHCLKNH